jgi:hypothetical protein
MDILTRLRLGRNAITVQDPLESADNAREAEIFYNQLGAYYATNGLYTNLSYALEDWTPAMRPLRNPANRSVEFFVSKLMPGTLPEALPVIADNERIVEPIETVWKWTNLNAKKPMAIRWFSIYGDLWIHPTSNDTNTRVYMQFLKPQVITEWTEDDRGFVDYLRLDVPQGELTHTEVWSPDWYATWEHRFGRYAQVDHLGEPLQEGPTSEFGIDFVPFVHTKFRDVGDKRGWGAYTHCLDKIDEANKMATRLHQMLFRYNKPYFGVSANSVDSSGAPLPPPNMTGIEEDASEDTMIYNLPGNSTMTSLIPDIRYADALAVLQDQIGDIEKDLPELAYYGLKEQSDLSGKAIRLLLSGAIDRTEEARANFEQGLQRAENMALTMGVHLELFDQSIGNYDAGDFDHQYTKRDVLEVSTDEKADTLKILIEAGVPLTVAARLAGFQEGDME